MVTTSRFPTGHTTTNAHPAFLLHTLNVLPDPYRLRLLKSATNDSLCPGIIPVYSLIVYKDKIAAIRATYDGIARNYRDERGSGSHVGPGRSDAAAEVTLDLSGNASED